jgi:hypothetical protein
VRLEARKLAGTIWNNERIRALAEYPLLLTTLLVVKRWIGELPRGRAALYGEAVRVLTRTWNVEGYMPLDEGETLTQLSYVACAMMEQGIQQIGHKALLELLQNARQELEAELQFAQGSVRDFVERISLLMQIGHDWIDSELQPIYEFRHLTFQEYLAARGYVEETYPGRRESRSLADLIEPHIGDWRWREVIPLVAVQAKRKAEDLVQRLTQACERSGADELEGSVRGSAVFLLLQCLLDEVQVTTPTLRAALLQMAQHGGGIRDLEDLQRGKFGKLFQEVVEKAYFESNSIFEQYRPVLTDLAVEFAFGDQLPSVSVSVVKRLAQKFASKDRIERVYAALACGYLAFIIPMDPSLFEKLEEGSGLRGLFDSCRESLFAMLDSDDLPLTMPACWALVWVGDGRISGTPPNRAEMITLYQLWRKSTSSQLARMAAWAFFSQPLLPRETFGDEVWGEDRDEWLRETSAGEDTTGEFGALVTAWYRRAPWSDPELAKRIGEAYARRSVVTKVQLESC